MLFPIRCWTCNRPLAHMYDNYTDKLANGMHAKQVLEDLHIERYCCKRMFLTYVPMLADTVASLKKDNGESHSFVSQVTDVVETREYHIDTMTTESQI